MIMILRGPEGSGKTLWMTRFLKKYYLMGGTVLTFPGYNLLHKGQQVSKVIEPEEWAAMPDDLTDLAIGVDEADSFFDAYRYNSVGTMLFHGVEKQRRKRRLIIIMTVQDEGWLPTRMRQSAHVVADCWDLYWSYKQSKRPFPRGEMVQATFWDNKGFYTGYPGQFMGQHLLIGKIYWKDYDTNQVVDNFNKFMRMKVNKKLVNIYPDGLPEPKKSAEQFSVMPTGDDTFDVDTLRREGMSVTDIFKLAKLKGRVK